MADTVKFDNVSVTSPANIYFDGKCVSHSIVTAHGNRKTLGVIFSGPLTFTTKDPEQMDIVRGRCRVLLPGEDKWVEYGPGDVFTVPGESSFEIDVLGPVDYVCHYVGVAA
ncbi:MAG: pyrimidine/purine nucleoside phosphorylase [Thiomonas delicata]